MDKLTPEQLAEIAERCEKATQGPWLKGMWNGRCHKTHEGPFHPGLPYCKYDFTLDTKPPVVSLSQENYVLIGGDEHGWILSQPDATFIASSRTDIPDLLDHIKALEEENVRYKGALEEIEDRVQWGNTENACIKVLHIVRKILKGDSNQ